MHMWATPQELSNIPVANRKLSELSNNSRVRLMQIIYMLIVLMQEFLRKKNPAHDDTSIACRCKPDRVSEKIWSLVVNSKSQPHHRREHSVGSVCLPATAFTRSTPLIMATILADCFCLELWDLILNVSSAPPQIGALRSQILVCAQSLYHWHRT